MKDGFVTLLVIMTVILVSSGVTAQEPEVFVGDIGFPEHVWGKQNLAFEITNNTDWLKCCNYRGRSYRNRCRLNRR